jgi:hypothetical protein
MDEVLDQVILPRISAATAAEGDAPDEGLRNVRADLSKVLAEDSFAFVPGLASAVGRTVFGVVVPRMIGPLRLLRSFSTAGYRAGGSAGAGSSAAVQVVHQMFAPLEAYLQRVRAVLLPAELQRRWVEPLLAETFRRYTTTMETIAKNQQSLIRLKKMQNPGVGFLGFFKSTSTDSTDTTHPASQATELVDTFTAKLQATGLGIDLDTFTPWLQLKTFLLSQDDDM